MSRLAIIGPLPPPYGGIAVHLERLLPHLERAGLDYRVYNTFGATEVPGRAVSVASRKYAWYLEHLLRGPEPVAYFLTVRWPVWVGSLVLSRLRGRRVIFNLQGDDLRIACETHGPAIRRLLLAALRAAHAIIAASPHIRDHLVTLGDFGDKTIVVPGFIPPTRAKGDAEQISPEIRAFCAEHDPVLLGTGAAVLRGGVDLYGVDMTLDLVERLRDRHPRLGCLWSLIEIVGSSPEYADQLRAEVARRGLGASWLFTPPQKIFYPVYELVDLLVRPTLSDGDALSIREALSLGLPVLASDSAPRPEETIVFRSRDQENYEQRARQTLQQLESVRQRLAHRPAESAVQAEVDLLRVALEGDPSG